MNIKYYEQKKKRRKNTATLSTRWQSQTNHKNTEAKINFQNLSFELIERLR